MVGYQNLTHLSEGLYQTYITDIRRADISQPAGLVGPEAGAVAGIFSHVRHPTVTVS